MVATDLGLELKWCVGLKNRSTLISTNSIRQQIWFFGDVIFKDLSQEYGDYRFGFGAEMMCWIQKQVNFD
jgi:hypothetical protein